MNHALPNALALSNMLLECGWYPLLIAQWLTGTLVGEGEGAAGERMVLPEAARAFDDTCPRRVPTEALELVTCSARKSSLDKLVSVLIVN